MDLTTVHPRITDYLQQYAKETPHREAVIFGEQRITYAALEKQVTICAKALLAMGINKGDRIAVLSTPRLEFWVLFLATARIGGIWLGVNPKYTLDECRHVIGDAQPKLLFALAEFEGSGFSATVQSLMSENDCVKRAIAILDTMPGALPYPQFLEQANEVSDATLDLVTNAVERLDPALLVYTSGSTGKPKGALLSHYGLCFGALVQNELFQVDDLRLICNFPINHVGSVADTCGVVLVVGGTLVLQERFDPGLVLRTIEQEHLTLLAGVPTMLLMLLEHPNFNQTNFSSLEVILWGGAALPEQAIKRLQAVVPRLMNAYGLTETAANTIHTRPNADLIELSETVGRPNPHMPCRIVNSEGQLCAVGEQGELQFQGEYLLLEYLNRPDATRDVYTEDGWLHTGDIGYLREEGTISLVGRMSDMFKSGGYNVYPREIEILLESHPDIEMAAVVSVPDERYQEVGAAYVLAASDQALDTELLRAFCKGKLANYKVPKYFKVVADLPLLPVGKVDKVALKKRAKQQIAEVI